MEQEKEHKFDKSSMTFTEKVKKELREIESFEFEGDSLRNAGEWPLLIKVIFPIICFTGLLILVSKFYFGSMKNNYDYLLQEEKRVKEEVIFKINQTAGMELYRDRIQTMEESFNSLLAKLPTAIEMDGLLKDITEKGIENGVEFKKLQMLKEIDTQFYTEHPIEIIIQGTYHSLSKFISDVSTLGRIVTFHDFELKPIDIKNEESLLELKIVAKTYKYREQKDGE